MFLSFDDYFLSRFVNSSLTLSSFIYLQFSCRNFKSCGASISRKVSDNHCFTEIDSLTNFVLIKENLLNPIIFLPKNGGFKANSHRVSKANFLCEFLFRRSLIVYYVIVANLSQMTLFKNGETLKLITIYTMFEIFRVHALAYWSPGFEG